MKKILSIIFLVLSMSPAFANTDREVELCFEILNEQVQLDPRFQNLSGVLPRGDLTEVLLSESAGTYVDLSLYEEFKKYRAINSLHNQGRENKGHENTHFLARRTNIATVITEGESIVTEVVGFGRDSNFTFPISSKIQEKPFGDPYTLNGIFFKEFVLYTHHNFNNEFMSCGLFRLQPLSGRTYGNVADTSYMTNVLTGNTTHSELNGEKCNSGFNLPNANGIEREGERFLPMRTNVCAIDYDQKDFVKQEILAIAYDNNSEYLNEYDVFQLQVQAMKNTDITSGSMFSVRESFLASLQENTCFRYIHKNTSNLPAKCNGEFKSGIFAFLSPSSFSDIFARIGSWLYPKAEAMNLNYSDEEIEENIGLVVFEGLPYSIYQKIGQIPNTTFQEYIKIALTPNFDDFILHRKNANIVLTPFEEVFLNCNISYQERQDIIIKLIESYDDMQKFDIAGISYSNPRFGDCIIPFPDKDHRDKVIEDSFDTNQLLAMQLNGEYVPDALDSDFALYIEKNNALEAELQGNIDAITQRYNEGSISQEELQSSIDAMKLEYEEKKQDLETQYTQSFLSDQEDTIIPTQNFKVSIIVFILLIIGILLIVGAYMLRQKNTK